MMLAMLRHGGRSTRRLGYRGLQIPPEHQHAEAHGAYKAGGGGQLAGQGPVTGLLIDERQADERAADGA